MDLEHIINLLEKGGQKNSFKIKKGLKRLTKIIYKSNKRTRSSL